MRLKKLFLLRENQKGQMLLVVILIMVLVLTISLSIASRSITNVNTTTNEDASQRAFAAAEAGIEQALNTKCPSGSCLPSSPLNSYSKTSFSSQYNANIANKYFIANTGNIVAQDDGVDIWLVDKDPVTYKIVSGSGWLGNGATTNNVSVYWGNNSVSDPCSDAAIEVVTITGTIANPVSQRYVADPCSARSALNNFSSVTKNSYTVNGITYPYTLTSPIQIAGSQGIYIRVTSLYTGTLFQITSDQTNIPVQQGAALAVSTGNAGDTTRKVQVYQQLNCPPEFCQHSFFQP